ncbi:hypothetical protein C0Q70_21378 [Pomacea canaliculata]|uniref:Uncharacterized protein n=1 Tax=Pomacea canaliculata TaxID=400727 RepID=A0A2T7NCE2_POMCA|nr:hypothetical protein C0Q70_21378 [Pomacea canaliculata]
MAVAAWWSGVTGETKYLRLPNSPAPVATKRSDTRVGRDQEVGSVGSSEHPGSEVTSEVPPIQSHPSLPFALALGVLSASSHLPVVLLRILGIITEKRKKGVVGRGSGQLQCKQK